MNTQLQLQQYDNYFETKRDEPSETNLARMVYEHYLDNIDYHDPFFNNMVEDFGFWDGTRQWIQTVNGKVRDFKKEREADGKPALTKNKLFAMVNLVCGIQEQEPMEMRCVARSKEDGPIADGNNDVLKWQWDTNNGNRKISRQFWSMLICGRGWLEIAEEYDQDSLFGTKTNIYYVDPAEIMYDRKSQEYDLSDCDQLQRTRTISRAKAKLIWPDKTYELNQYYTFLDSNIQSLRMTMDRISYLRRDVQFLEDWHIEYELHSFLIDSATGIFEDVTTLPEELKSQLIMLVKATPTMKLIHKQVKCMKFIRSAGPTSGIILDSGKSPYDDSYFQYVPMFAYRSRDLDFGMIMQVKDPQREVNKRSSQFLQLLNEMPKTRLVVDDPEAADKFEQGDDIIVLARGSNFKVVEPPQMSMGHARMEEIGKDDIKTISGVNDTLSGIREGTEPGIVVNLRRNQQMSNIMPLFGNAQESLKLCAKILMSRKRQFMSPEQIARIIGYEKANQLIMGSEGEQIRLIDAIKSRAAEEFDINIIQTPSSPSIRVENFAKLEALVKMMPQLQALIPDVIVESSDIPQKDEINSRIEQAMHIQQQQNSAGAPLSAPNSAGTPLSVPGT